MALNHSIATAGFPGDDRNGRDMDGDGNHGSQPRRRTQVACQRCRKRKIKCSGDIGDGSGCTNCRNAAIPSCVFLRVNSEEFTYNPPNWNRPNYYSLHLGENRLQATQVPPSLVPLPGYNPATSRNARPCLGYRDGMTSLTMARDAYNSFNYPDPPAANYPLSAPAYMPPVPDFTGSQNGFGTTFGRQRSWPSADANSLRPSSANTNYNETGTSLINQTPASYMSTAMSFPPAVEMPALLSAGPVSIGLSSSDRILPSPVTTRATGTSSFPARSSVPDTAQAAANARYVPVVYQPMQAHDWEALPQAVHSASSSPNSTHTPASTTASTTVSAATTSNENQSPIQAADIKPVPSSSRDGGFGYHFRDSPVLAPETYKSEPEDDDDTDSNPSPYTRAIHVVRVPAAMSANFSDASSSASSSRVPKRRADSASEDYCALMNGQQYTRLRQAPLYPSLGPTFRDTRQSEEEADLTIEQLRDSVKYRK